MNRLTTSPSERAFPNRSQLSPPLARLQVQLLLPLLLLLLTPVLPDGAAPVVKDQMYALPRALPTESTAPVEMVTVYAVFAVRLPVGLKVRVVSSQVKAPAILGDMENAPSVAA